MLTPLIMIGLLVTPALLWLLVRRRPVPARVGVLGLTLVFIFTGLGHFIETEAMAQMIPPGFPAPVMTIYLTGIFEMVLGVALLVPRLRRPAGWVAIVMLVGFLPFNIYAAMHHIPMGGHEWGPSYLLIRVPLQLLLIGWAWWFAIRPPSAAAGATELRGDPRPG